MHSMENRPRVKGPLPRGLTPPPLTRKTFGEPALWHLTRSIHISGETSRFPFQPLHRQGMPDGELRIVSRNPVEGDIHFAAAPFLLASLSSGLFGRIRF